MTVTTMDPTAIRPLTHAEAMRLQAHELAGRAPATGLLTTVVLDDLVVPDMQEVLRLWHDAYPEFGYEVLPLEKQAAVLRRS